MRFSATFVCAPELLVEPRRITEIKKARLVSSKSGNKMTVKGEVMFTRPSVFRLWNYSRQEGEMWQWRSNCVLNELNFVRIGPSEPQLYMKFK
jgi:hypothetical protein